MAYGKCLKCITAYINSFCSRSLAWVLSWFNSNTSLLRNLFCISYAATVSCIFSHSTDAVEIWFGDSICSSTTCLLKLKIYICIIKWVKIGYYAAYEISNWLSKLLPGRGDFCSWLMSFWISLSSYRDVFTKHHFFWVKGHTTVVIYCLELFSSGVDGCNGWEG